MPPQDWLRCRANPRLFLRTLIQRIPGLDPDALVDLFDYKRSSGPEEAFVTCTLRVRTEACGGLLASSGVGGLFIKDFSNSGTVEWQRPLPGEPPRPMLDRILRLSELQHLMGAGLQCHWQLGPTPCRGGPAKLLCCQRLCMWHTAQHLTVLLDRPGIAGRGIVLHHQQAGSHAAVFSCATS